MLLSFSYNILKNITLSELKTLRVAVKRNNVTTSAPPGPLERDIDDPRDIIPCVHYRKGNFAIIVHILIQFNLIA